MSRSTHALAVLGPELYAKLPTTRVLLVGAGGIGCELLKNVVLTGFGDITLLDLDTIDLSNLNRQFLFKKKDVKQSKALVAARTASQFNPNVRITPIHANIKEPQFDLAWFKQFDIVLNALDNLDARRHVNKMCMAGRVPLVESGTAGYLGQVQPLLKDTTECFDCLPKPTPKTFPVCTIRSTPSQPIHCIVWAKSYLVPQLFGEDEDEGDLDEAERQGENATEIATLRKEAQAFKKVRDALRTGSIEDAPRLAFDKVFRDDIQNLLKMQDMWRTRQPPVPLDFEQISSGNFVLRATQQPSTDAPAGPSQNNGSGHAAGLKDQRALSLNDNLAMFVSSSRRLAQRLRSGEDTISFDKDDDDTLDFVTAASNLRSAAYDIPRKSRWEVKEMAGNIIPAIATTNAIVSGLIVLQALQLLCKNYNALKNVHLQFKPSAPLGVYSICPPAPNCGICRDTYIEVKCDPNQVTLGEVIKGVLGDGGSLGGTGPREVSAYEGQRVLSDPDWDDNYERTLESLGCGQGKFLNITDEENEWGVLSLAITLLPDDYPEGAPPLLLPSPLPTPVKKPRSATPPPTSPPVGSSLKRPAPDNSDGPASKRAKVHPNGHATPSPSKAAKLEEDGVIVIGDEFDVILVDD